MAVVAGLFLFSNKMRKHSGQILLTAVAVFCSSMALIIMLSAHSVHGGNEEAIRLGFSDTADMSAAKAVGITDAKTWIAKKAELAARSAKEDQEAKARKAKEDERNKANEASKSFNGSETAPAGPPRRPRVQEPGAVLSMLWRTVRRPRRFGSRPLRSSERRALKSRLISTLGTAYPALKDMGGWATRNITYLPKISRSRPSRVS